LNAKNLMVAWAVVATVAAVIAVRYATEDDDDANDANDRDPVENRSPAPETPRPRTPAAPDDDAIAALQLEVSKLTTRLGEAQAKAAEDARHIARLTRQLEPYLQQTRATVQDVAAMLDAMREKGMSSLLEPAKVAKLVGDIRALGDEGFDLVLGMMGSENPQERMLAAKLLGDLADERSIDALAKACADDDDGVCTLASQALALMGDPRAKDQLRQIYDSSEGKAGVRINSLFGLCKIGEAQAITEAQAFFESSETPDAHKSAMANGILLLDSPHVVPVVRSVSGLDKSSADLGTAVVRYLEKVRNDSHARTLLADIIADSSYPQSVRNLASQVLAQ